MSLKKNEPSSLSLLPQTSTSAPVFGKVEVPHPSGTRLQSTHHTGAAQQGQSTYQGLVVQDTLCCNENTHISPKNVMCSLWLTYLESRHIWLLPWVETITIVLLTANMDLQYYREWLWCIREMWRPSIQLISLWRPARIHKLILFCLFQNNIVVLLVSSCLYCTVRHDHSAPPLSSPCPFELWNASGFRCVISTIFVGPRSTGR